MPPFIMENLKIREFLAEQQPRSFHSDLELESWWSRYSDLDLEIGAGTGLHAIEYARANPSRALIAIERTKNKFVGFECRSRQMELPNLLSLRDEAVRFCAQYLPEARVSRIFFLYPNPYPKKRQANKRWHNSSFFDFLSSRLKPKGEIILASNLGWYLKEAEKGFCERGFEVISQKRISPGIEARTAFEKKYLERGEVCHEIQFRKF